MIKGGRGSYWEEKKSIGPDSEEGSGEREGEGERGGGGSG